MHFKDIDEEDLILSPFAFVPPTNLATSGNIPEESSQDPEDVAAPVQDVIPDSEGMDTEVQNADQDHESNFERITDEEAIEDGSREPQ